MENYLAYGVVLLSSVLFQPELALADDAETANRSNNPLSNSSRFVLQDYYPPDVADTAAYNNDLQLRRPVPLTPSGFIVAPQLLGATVPIRTRPMRNGYNTEDNALRLNDIFLTKANGIQLGFGPQITPRNTAYQELGASQWQAGLAAIAIDTSPYGVVGALVQYQSSFAGDDDRREISTATFQPFLTYNLSKGWYLRSTGTWSFDLKDNTHYIPVGLGIGKAWKVGKNLFNAFVEPQWTVAQKGDGLPRFTIFAGLNITFGE